MPPKRRRATAEEAEPQDDAALIRNTRLTTLATALPEQDSALAPLPAKHTTSYGSPAAVLPLENSGAYGSNLKAATRDIFAAVRRENKKAKLDHESSQPEGSESVESPRARRPPESTPREPLEAETPEPPSSPPPPGSGEGASEPENEPEQEDDTATAAPSGQFQTSAEIATGLRRLEARREERERAEQRGRERAEREARARARREEREQAEQEARERAEQEAREREQKQKERAEREKVAAARSREEAARRRLPKKRSGQEFLDELFAPKRPRPNNQTPLAPHLAAQRRRNATEPPESVAMSTRSFIEESHVFREADVQTPAPSSVMGDTPSRRAGPSSAAARASSLPPVPEEDSLRTGLTRISRRPDESQVVWHAGPNARSGPGPLNPRPTPSQPNPQPEPSQSRENEPDSRPDNSADRQGDNGPGKELPEESNFTPRRSSRRSRTNLGPPAGRRTAAAEPADEPEPRRDARVRPDNKPPSSAGSSQQEKDSHVQRRRVNNKRSQPRNDANPRREPDPLPPQEDPPPGDTPSPVDQLRKAWNSSKHYLPPLGRILRLIAYFIALVFAIHMWRRVGSSGWENNGVDYGLEWYGWGHMGQNIGQLVPYSLRHPLGFLTDDEYNALRDHINSQDGRIIKLTDASNDLRHATQKLEGILPRVVSVKQDKKTNKLVIGQDFWHALKDLVHAEKSILTLEPSKDGTNNISDDHWVAVLKRLKAEGVLSTKDVDGIVRGAVSSTWDSWLKSNRGKVDKVLGVPSGQQLSPDSEKKLLAEVDKLVRDKVSGPGLRDIVVTREEFIREVEKSITAHRRETNAELAHMQEVLKSMVEAAKKAVEKSGGMTRQEVLALTNEAIQKAISNARLEGTAKGNINNNFEVELSRRVNYFSLGNGATIDRSLTSPTYDYPPHQKHRFGSQEWVKDRISAPRFVPEEAAALTAWEEAGHCWCAGNKFKDTETHPADINIRLARSIIPENVVMEHIDPAATIDPKAMPKDIEVWAMVDEYTRRRHAWDFMFAQWPDTPEGHPLLQAGFLKIGQFTYEHDRATNGVHVYKISDELANLDVMTDLVLVRAVTNYGADHTCFYRVRLYGTARGLDDDELGVRG